MVQSTIAFQQQLSQYWCSVNKNEISISFLRSFCMDDIDFLVMFDYLSYL
jgi:hypothetical protein